MEFGGWGVVTKNIQQNLDSFCLKIFYNVSSSILRASLLIINGTSLLSGAFHFVMQGIKGGKNNRLGKELFFMEMSSVKSPM